MLSLVTLFLPLSQTLETPLALSMSWAGDGISLASARGAGACWHTHTLTAQ